MAADSDAGETALSPNEAFAVLGNETRMSIIQVLAEATHPLPFSELRERVGVSDSGQFNYHLDKLTGHFLETTEAGYRLHQIGERVVEAVQAGTITEQPPATRTQTDLACEFCGAPIAVSISPWIVELYCTECSGRYDRSAFSDSDTGADEGYLGMVRIPPAGLDGRTPEEAYLAANLWSDAEIVLKANGVCPRCSGRVETTAEICEDHTRSGGPCENCGFTTAIRHATTCTNCIYDTSGVYGVLLSKHMATLDFLTDHGIYPFGMQSREDHPLFEYEEELRSADPFEATFTYTYEGEALQLTVDDEFEVVDVKRKPATGSS